MLFGVYEILVCMGGVNILCASDSNTRHSFHHNVYRSVVGRVFPEFFFFNLCDLLGYRIGCVTKDLMWHSLDFSM